MLQNNFDYPAISDQMQFRGLNLCKTNECRYMVFATSISIKWTKSKKLFSVNIVMCIICTT